MQSAFVDIGLERDAFLYVSDFLEVGGDEEDEEEFGSIPVPRNAIDVSKAHAAQEAQLKAESAVAEPEIAEESEVVAEDFGPADGPPVGEDVETSPSSDQDSAEGTRPWRGRRRRRGGRRGQGDERNDRPEPKTEIAKPAPIEEAPAYHPETRPPARPRTDYGPPAGYTPIVLPGESISKYRNLSQPPTAEPQNAESKDEETMEQVAFAPVEDFTPSSDLNSRPGAAVEETESQPDLELPAVEPDRFDHAAWPSAETSAVIAHKETEHTETVRHDDEPDHPELLSVAPPASFHAQPEATSPDTSYITATEVEHTAAQNQTLVGGLPIEAPSAEFPAVAEEREQGHNEAATVEVPVPPLHELLPSLPRVARLSMKFWKTRRWNSIPYPTISTR